MARSRWLWTLAAFAAGYVWGIAVERTLTDLTEQTEGRR